MYVLSNCVNTDRTFEMYGMIRMSVPFTPPSPKFIPIEEVARRHPTLGYQVYFASENSTPEIVANVGHFRYSALIIIDMQSWLHY
jgi:hypothetical protein